ncbi:DUF371 domain-containing protein [Candidatus Bathyarchaeota archaeon]|nr:DUF371 domain-containing protein [Candidatus Bathyarchaeota archaeon]
MRVVEIVEAWGHPNVTAKNKTTFEITKETHLTKRGDCIIAIQSSKGAQDLREEFKKLVKREDAKITVKIEVGEYMEVAIGKGNPHLTLSHATDLVIRKSNYFCNRTLMVGSDKAARDFSLSLIRAVQNPSQKVLITLLVEV